MILNLHSFSKPIKINSDDIITYVYNVELDKNEVVLRTGVLVPLDEEPWEIEELFQTYKKKKRK